MIRNPIVSDVFYPSQPPKLIETIRGLFTHQLGPGAVPPLNKKKLDKSIGLVLPHAGYMYSGPVAAWGLSEVMKIGTPESVMLIGPSHTGMGKPISIWDKGSWKTPLGELQIHRTLAQRILSTYEYAQPDFNAHINEHSLEVQLPLLQFCFGTDFSIIPIAMMDQRKNTAQEMGHVIHAISETQPLLIIASSDLNHYEPHDRTIMKDQEIIDSILTEDIDGLYAAITEDQISMCGFGAVAALMEARIGTPKLLQHASSGDSGGDFSHVVGYASLIFDSGGRQSVHG